MMTHKKAVHELKQLLGISLKFTEHEAIAIAIAALEAEPLAVGTVYDSYDSYILGFRARLVIKSDKNITVGQRVAIYGVEDA
jgi:hypothetical protein